MFEHEKYYREVTKGAWPFSTRTQSYTVSDCTAEGMKAVLMLQNRLDYTEELVNDSRLKDAVNVLLTMQNDDGGFASYEKTRGHEWLELLNPAEVFGNIMIEYSYPECTTASLLGLSYFRKQFPDHRRDEIEYRSFPLTPSVAIERAIQYIISSQREDGSWFGSWAICFTYATFFALESLSSVGQTYWNSPRVRKACEFLLSKQMPDGGWGEKYKACEIGEWVNHETSQVVNTCWAVLALLAVGYPDREPIQRGIMLIKRRQQPSGEWLQENIEGVFNKVFIIFLYLVLPCMQNCMISYPNYKLYFTIWALGRYANTYDNKF